MKLKATIITTALMLTAVDVHAQADNDWMQDLASRITLNGYAQGGWAYQDADDRKTNA